jgi:hypothetical protein
VRPRNTCDVAYLRFVDSVRAAHPRDVVVQMPNVSGRTVRARNNRDLTAAAVVARIPCRHSRATSRRPGAPDEAGQFPFWQRKQGGSGAKTTDSKSETMTPGSARLWFVSTATVVASPGRCRTDARNPSRRPL